MVHLNTYTTYSMLRGVITPSALVQHALETGMRALAITDIDGLYGAVPFYKAARSAGIKPIIGVTLGDVVFLTRDRAGYAALCELITDYHSKGDLSDIPRCCEASVSKGDSPSHVEVISTNPSVLDHLLAQGVTPLMGITHYGDSRGRSHVQKMLDFAQSRHLRAVALNPVYFLKPENFEAHRVLTAIRLNCTVTTIPEAELARRDDVFRTPAEIEEIYRDWPKLLRNTEWVAERCNLELDMGTPLFPHCDTPADESPFSYLYHLAYQGARERYRPLTPKVAERLQYELDIIEQLGFAEYFLIVWDIVQFARSRDIPIVGRGSAANSLVAYALGITRADPFKYDLYFERFLNLARTDCPDIDLDIAWRQRDEVINYVYETYGAERVAMISTHNTFRARSAIRETAKALGLTEQEIKPIVRGIPHFHAGDIRAVVNGLPEARGLRIDEEPLKSIVTISEQIDGLPRHLSIHSGGVVIAPRELSWFTPLQRAAKGILITQYDMGPIEELGLVKMDLLGHRSLSVIDDAVRMVRENRGIPLDIEDLPDPDPLSASLTRDGQTIGCFQIESPAMRALLKQTSADSTDMLIKTLSLVRPGPSGSGMKKRFIECRHGRAEPEYLHPALETVLGDTYGVMLYQEDILKVAHVIAGISLAEADALRRATSSKKGSEEALAASMHHFMQQAKANGVTDNVAEAIWGRIANFAGYSYCKAHASTYGELAYQCVYLKAHFPAEFFAAVLSNRGGFYAPAVYMEEARRRGAALRPPDVFKSDCAYTVEDEAIRMGLLEVGQVSQHAIQRLLKERQRRSFTDFLDMVDRTGLARDEAEALIESGACAGFGHTRHELRWMLMLNHAKLADKPAVREQQTLYATPNGIPIRPDYAGAREHVAEWDSCGWTLHAHPVARAWPQLAETACITSQSLRSYIDCDVCLVGWLIAERRVALKEGRGCMKFLTFEDATGVFEAVLFPKAYQACGHLLTTQGPFELRGRVQSEDGYCAVMVQTLKPITCMPSASPGR